MKKLTVEEYYTKKYHKPLGYWHVYEDLLKYIKEPILDLACGYGALENFLRKNGFKDIDMVDFYCDIMSNDSRFMRFNLNKFPYPIKKKYKTIFLMSTLSYLDAPYATLKEVHKLLEDDGIFIVSFITSSRPYKKLDFKVPYIFTKKTARWMLETADHDIVAEFGNPILGLKLPRFIWRVFPRRRIWFVCRKND